MKKLFFILTPLLFLQLGMVAYRPHPDPDRPKIYRNYYWQEQPELAGKLQQANRLERPPVVEKLSGCMGALDYLIVLEKETHPVELDLGCFGGLARWELIVAAKGDLKITAFPASPSRADESFRIERTTIEKRVRPDGKPFRVTAAAQIQDERFSFYNASSRELLDFPVQKQVKSLHVTLLAEDSVFDWRILERFPELRSLTIGGATGFLHADEAKAEHLLSLTLEGCRDIRLPPLKLLGITLDNCSFTPDLFQRFDAEKLSDISIADADFDDIGFLARFSECINLALTGCPKLKDITPVAALKQLRILSVTNTAVEDIAVLSRLSELSLVTLKDNRIADLSPVAGCRFERFKISGGNPAADRPFPPGVPEDASDFYQIIYPGKVKFDDKLWDVELTGKRTADTYALSSIMLYRSDRHFPFRLEPGSGRPDYPAAGEYKTLYFSDGDFKITIKEGRFTDRLRFDGNKVILDCDGGEIVRPLEKGM